MRAETGDGFPAVLKHRLGLCNLGALPWALAGGLREPDCRHPVIL